MAVELDEDGRPIAWDGDDNKLQKGDSSIPNPPEPPEDYRWTGSRWVHDPLNSSNISSMSNNEIAEALREGDIPPRKVLAQLLEERKI